MNGGDELCRNHAWIPIFASKCNQPKSKTTVFWPKKCDKTCFLFFSSERFQPLEFFKRKKRHTSGWQSRTSWEDTPREVFCKKNHLHGKDVMTTSLFHIMLYPSLLPCCPVFFKRRLQNKTKRHLINPIRPDLQKVLARKEQSPRSPERERFGTMSSNSSCFFSLSFLRVIFAYHWIFFMSYKSRAKNKQPLEFGSS